MRRLIVSDSSSNLFKFDQSDYRYVSLKIISSEKEYVDDENLNVAAMVEELEKLPTGSKTSCPNTGEWLAAFEGYDEIFAVTISSSLSGSYNAACLACKQYEEEHPGVKTTVLDSLETGPGMELIIEHLAECEKKGLDFAETEKSVRAYMQTTHLCFSLASISNLAKNGRVSELKAKLVGLLGMRLLGRASPEGTIEIVNRSRGDKKAVQVIIEEMLKCGYAGGKVIISHVLNLDLAEKVRTAVREKFAKAEVVIDKCAGLCSFYAERSGMIIGYECKQ